MPHPISILTIAGSDCSAGAGLQADLKTFQHFHLHGLTAVTCIVSETANIVRRVDPVSPSMLEDQILLMLESFPLQVVKTGMLGSAAHVAIVSNIFKKHPHIKLVVDPVMVASTGASLLETDAIETYRQELIPLAYIITPNLPEAETLLNTPITSLAEMQSAARQLSSLYGCATLLKGGHLNTNDCTDILIDGHTIHTYTSPRLNTPASHGTGCTLAASLASALALGQDLPTAAQTAKNFLIQSLTTSYSFLSPNSQTLHALNQSTTPNRK